MHSFRLFFASSVCTLLLSAEETTTSVIKAISVMNVLKSLVASSLKLLNFFDTSGDISSVFFNAEAQRSHCTNNVTLLQLCRVGLNQPTTGSTGHRHGGDSWTARDPADSDASTAFPQVHTCSDCASYDPERLESQMPNGGKFFDHLLHHVSSNCSIFDPKNWFSAASIISNNIKSLFNPWALGTGLHHCSASWRCLPEMTPLTTRILRKLTSFAKKTTCRIACTVYSLYSASVRSQDRLCTPLLTLFGETMFWIPSCRNVNVGGPWGSGCQRGGMLSGIANPPTGCFGFLWISLGVSQFLTVIKHRL